jgi:hypothetical protein
MFVGRDREIASLDLVLDAAVSGHGAFRALSGEAGIGKTRLADEVVGRAITKGFFASWGRAWETGGAPAYWPWIELLGPLADVSGDLTPRVRELLGSSSSAPAGDGTRADPARERFELFESVSAFVRACARERPLLLVFDDLHLADAASLDLLAFVAHGLRTSRIVALGTYRDAEARHPRVADRLARVTREGDGPRGDEALPRGRSGRRSPRADRARDRGALLGHARRRDPGGARRGDAADRDRSLGLAPR